MTDLITSPPHRCFEGKRMSKREQIERLLAKFNGSWPADDPGFDQYFNDTRGAWAKQADAILAELREPDERMRRAWVVASCSDDFDPDAQEPVPGTGQGDLRYAPAWENMWDTLDCWKRHQAMIDAIK